MSWNALGGGVPHIGPGVAEQTAPNAGHHRHAPDEAEFPIHMFALGEQLGVPHDLDKVKSKEEGSWWELAQLSNMMAAGQLWTCQSCPCTIHPETCNIPAMCLGTDRQSHLYIHNGSILFEVELEELFVHPPADVADKYAPPIRWVVSRAARPCCLVTCTARGWTAATRMR